MNQVSIYHSRGPVVERQVLRLFERVTVGGRAQFVPFEREILWVRESEASVYLRHRGVEIERLCTFTDFYGYLTSAQYAVEEAPERQARYRIEPGDHLAIEVELDVFDVPLLADDSPAGKKWNAKLARRQYLRPADTWYTADEPDASGIHFPRLERRLHVRAEPIYSSPQGYFGQARVEALSDAQAIPFQE